jgi:hypothetical protein
MWFGTSTGGGPRKLGVLLAVVPAVVSTASGCFRAVSTAQTAQPNPLNAPPGVDAPLESKHLHIRTKDMDVPRSIRMYQSAWFSVISKDRVRFHVVLVHKWEEMTDVRGWNVRLEDDQGRVYYPAEKEKSRKKFTKRSWDSDIHTA